MISVTSLQTRVVSNELLFASLQVAAEGVVITDASERILWVNHAFTRLTGYSAEEAAGQTPKIVQSGYHGPAFYAEMWKILGAGLHWQGIVVNRRKDGSLYQEELSITPLRNAAGETVNYIAIKRDVTEREDLAAKLRESERQFRRLFESAPIALYDTGRDGIIHRANRVACRLLGYHRADVVGRPFWEFVDPAEREKVRDMALAGIRQGTVPSMVERIYLNRSGGRVRVEEHQTLEVSSDGQITGIHSAMIDITERTSFQAALEESNLRYESLFVNSADSVFVIGVKPNGSFVVEEVNPAWEKVTGVPRSMVIGKTPEEILPPKQAAAVISRYQTCLELREPIAYEEALEFRTGVIHGQTQLAPLPNAAGEITRLAGFSRDLTERFQMEADLRSKEEQLRLVLEASRDGLWDWDVPNRVMKISQRWAEISGCSPDRLQLSMPEFLELIHPEDLSVILRVRQNSLAGDDSHFSLEYRTKVAEGEWKWVHARGPGGPSQ